MPDDIKMKDQTEKSVKHDDADLSKTEVKESKLDSKASATSKPMSWLPIAAGAVGALVLAGGVYLASTVLNVSSRVRDQVVPVNQVFSDLQTSVEKISADLLEESDSESVEAWERSLQKSKDYLEAAEKADKQLEADLKKVTVGQAKEYRAKVEDYRSKVKPIIDLERENTELFGGYIAPYGKIQNLSTDNAGLSEYMYTDPNKYVKEMVEYVEKYESYVKQLKDLKASGNLADLHDSFITKLSSMATFLKAVKDGVKNRDMEEVIAAQQAYAKRDQEDTKRYEKSLDELKEKTKELNSQAEDSAKQVNDSYSGLRAKYKF